MWETGRGDQLFHELQARRAVRLKRVPFRALVRKCWCPEDISGRRCLGLGLTVLTRIEQEKEEARCAVWLSNW